MIRLPRRLLQVSRARYASTATEASSSTSTTPPPPSSISHPPSTSSSSELSPVFGRHVPLPQTHGVHVATLHLRSYTSSVADLQFFTSFALRAAKALGLPTSGSVAVPTRTSLFTVPRSPFAHKKSQQNFWRKEHKRLIKVYDGQEEIVQAWLSYLRKESFGGVGMKAQVFSYREIGWGQGLGKSTLLEGREGVEGDLIGKEDELLGMVAGGDAAEIERLASELQEDLELDIERSEATPDNEQGIERKELEQVTSEENKLDSKEDKK